MFDLSNFGVLKAAEYMRYSTDNQTENSIAYQQAGIRKYARENNIQIVASFQDEAASGTNTDRKGFQALVAAAGRKAFDAVIIYDISRGSRDVGDWFTFRKSMMYLGIKVISASGQKRSRSRFIPVNTWLSTAAASSSSEATVRRALLCQSVPHRPIEAMYSSTSQ